MDVRRHVGRNLLLFWLELKDICVHQGLDLVLEDITGPSGWPIIGGSHSTSGHQFYPPPWVIVAQAV